MSILSTIQSPGFATLGFIQNIGHWELIVIFGIALLLFGSRLPKIGRSVGQAIVEFKRGIKGIEDDIESGSNAKNDSPSRQSPPGTLPSGSGAMDQAHVRSSEPTPSDAGAEQKSV